MAELYKVTTAGTPEFGGTFPCKPPNAMVGELCSAPHLSWTDAPLEEGEVFYIEMGGVRHRYHSPLSRCVYIGTPPKEDLRTTEVIREGLERVLEKAKPERAARSSRRHGARSSRGTASRRIPGSATRSGSAIRRPGAS
jgi:Xaa-Pro aminopeptidase